MGVDRFDIWSTGIVLVIASAAFAFAWLKLRSWTWTTAIVRAAALALLWGLLSGLYWEESGGHAPITVMVDISDSISAPQSQKLLNTAMELIGSEQLKILPFAKRTAPIATEISSPRFESLRSQWGMLDVGGTNLEDALIGLSSNIQEGPAFLITDANETIGRADNIIPYLTSAKISLFPLVPDNSETTDFVGITQMHAPLLATADKQTEIRVSLGNFSRSAVDGDLTLMQGQKQIYSNKVALAPGSESALVIQSDSAAPGLNEISATYRWREGSGALRESTQTILLAGENRERILLLNGSKDDDRFLSQALQSEAYQIESWAPGQQLKSNILSTYSVVILNNIPLTGLPVGAAVIREYVEKGGGLIMLGGAKSFGLGGYIGSPIEELLPVKLVPPQTTKKRLNVAVQLVIDKSKSMARGSKLEFAQDAANQVVRNLKDEDLVGIIAFDTVPFEVLPLVDVAKARSIAEDRINRLFANEATNMFPAVEEGWRSLLKVNAGRKHMIILTDGKVYDAGPIYEQLVRQIRVSGVTVSTVLLGQEGEEDMLRELAEVGGGSYYQTSDPQNLPRIFVSDVKVSTGEETLKEQNSFSVRRGTSPLRTTGITTYPILKGYVETLPREDAALELVASSGDRASPLLARWQFKQGKVVGFTSDSNGRWSAQWIGWQEFSRFWSDLLNAVRPTTKNASIPRFDIRRYIEHGELVLDATVYSDPAPNSLTATITTPTGRSESVVFTRTAAGRFIARVTRPEAGRYRAKLLAEETALPEVGWSISGELFGERKDLPPNRVLLDRLASSTGGKVNPSKADIVSQAMGKPTRYYPVLPLLALALLLFLLEVCARELQIFARLLSGLRRKVKAIRN